MQPQGQRQTRTVIPFTGARLCVVSNDQKGRIYPLGSRLTIGRGVNCDIVTADPRASRVHAEIQRHPDGRFSLTDPGSTNGTFVNGHRVGQVELRDGDVVQIGDFALIVELSVATAIQHEQHGTLVGISSAGTAPGSVPDVIDLRAIPVLQIGRDPGNHLTLDHPQISRFHARLQLLPDGSLQVTDLNSTNGTFINGQQLKGVAAVPSGATLSFGPYRLVFQQGQLIKATEDGTVRIDCLHLSKTVAGGKRLLNDLTFSILPREFVCLVGGSGAGKSTLLDALSGVRPANGGEVRYNGDDYYQQMDAFRSAIGYVPQDDIVPTELPVESALYYAAKLRLPPDMSEAEVRARVEEVMDDLGLTARRDVPIKNLSGGQRKRVSIGAELLSKPTLFFLDEPTSGLDPGLEGRMMQLLRKLADQGRTVILITHATQNVDMCDNIAFLAPGGYLAYYGPPGEALAYFGAEKFADIYTRIESEPAMEIWPQRFQHSPHCQQYVNARLAAAGIQLNGAGGGSGTYRQAVVKAQSRPPAAKQVSGFRQFGILTRRYLETVLRDRNNLLTLLVIQAPLIALLITLAFRGDIFSTEVFVGDYERGRSITFLLAMVAVWFGTSNSAREIVKEAPMYARERRINLKIAPYIASKFSVLIGISIIQNVLLLLPLLFTGAGVANLPILYLALLFGSIAGITMGLAISAVAPNPDRASILVPLVLIPQIIFGGPIINTKDNAVVDAISRFMVTKWTWKSLGSTVGIDNVPAKPVELAGFSPEQIQQLTATGANPNLIQRDGLLFYKPPIAPDFEFTPLVYLAILCIFIILSLCLVAFFQRRKDIVR
jgi:ABC-type multidrug transport system ATPase subunit/pSer/pThr/pTyr-binding forkhead associated (FHA) protein